MWLLKIRRASATSNRKGLKRRFSIALHVSINSCRSRLPFPPRFFELSFKPDQALAAVLPELLHCGCTFDILDNHNVDIILFRQGHLARRDGDVLVGIA